MKIFNITKKTVSDWSNVFDVKKCHCTPPWLYGGTAPVVLNFRY